MDAHIDRHLAADMWSQLTSPKRLQPHGLVGDLYGVWSICVASQKALERYQDVTL